ncbi:MAG TPA: hypothetical protein VFA68_14405 [Terriglobales bacterium]|nr:hypothetical protein [Terriglobales bacterium]
MMTIRTWSRSAAILLLGAGLMAFSAFADKGQTYTGEVSDAVCGAKHMMAGDAAGCTRECVGKGSKYALIVGTKVYTLDTSDKASLDELNKLAGQKAKLSGTASGDTIAVSSVAPAK